MEWKMKVTFTGAVGAIALFMSVILRYDLGVISGVVLTLGRAALPGIADIIKAWKGGN